LGETITTIAATLAVAIIVFAAGFHLHWAFGGKFGFSVSLPQKPDGRPIYDNLLPVWSVGALFVALALIAISVLAVDRAGILRVGIDPRLVTVALTIAGVACVARSLAWHRYVGVFKTLRTTRWARYDTWLYCPLFFALGMSLIYLATR